MSNIFRAYDVRGIYPQEINTDIAKRVGNAVVRYLEAHSTDFGQTKTIIVGEDGRIGSPELRRAVIEGITSAGTGVVYIGRCTTPLFYFAVNRLHADGGIMITASHNPAQYNGFKFVGLGSVPIAADSGLFEIEKLSADYVIADKCGGVKEANPVNDYVDEVIKRAGGFRNNLKVVIDASNGITSVTSKPLLDKLGISFIPLNFDIDGSFPNHSPDISKEENLQQLRKSVLDNGADLGLAFDGDGDRVVFIDKSGAYVRPDYILALLFKNSSSFFKKPKVVYDLRFTKSVREYFGSNGLRSKVGYTFIKKIMRETGADLGAELAGHFYLKDMNYSEAASLIMLRVLKIINREKKSLGELVKPWQKYFNSGEINIDAARGSEKISGLKAKYSDGKTDELDGLTVEYGNWWFNIRHSNTQPIIRLVVEADTKELMDQKVSELVLKIKKEP